MIKQEAVTLAFAFFASPKYLAAHGTPRRIEDLARHDHVGFLDRGIGLPSYIRWLQRLVPADRFVTSASTLLAMYELARAGSGIVLGTRALLAGDRRLVAVLPRARPPAMDIWLAVHADLRRDPQITQILDALAARCAHLSTM